MRKVHGSGQVQYLFTRIELQQLLSDAFGRAYVETLKQVEHGLPVDEIRRRVVQATLRFELEQLGQPTPDELPALHKHWASS